MNTQRHWISFAGTTALILLTAFALVGGTWATSQPAVHAALRTVRSTTAAQARGAALPAGLVPIVARTLAQRNPETWRAHTTGQAVVFDNPSQHLTASFSGEGAQLEFGGKQPAQLGMQLLALHRGNARYPMSAATPSANDNRVELNHGHGLTEWYVNSPLGVEQGFTIAAPSKSAASSQSLALVFKLKGNLTPVLKNNALTFRNAKGQAVLRYGDLLAYDAGHRALPAQMQLEGSTLLLQINTEGAHYPVTIDPLFAVVTPLAEPTAVAYDGFGDNVAISGDGNTALIGIPGVINNTANPASFETAGAAYLFTRTNGRWAQTPVASFTDPAHTVGDRFGASVALSSNGNTALIGAKFTGNGGAAYVYSKGSGDWSASPTASFADPAKSNGDLFGSSVALSDSGTTALIGDAFTSNGGSAYLYSEGSGAWPASPTASFADPKGTTDDGFGSSVALSGNGNTALIGAPGTGSASFGCCVGTAYLYIQNNGWPATPSNTFPSPQGAGVQANFGQTVALSDDGNTALIGSPGANAAYVYAASSGIWPSAPTQTFADPTGNSGNFGSSVALSGDGNTVLIGADGTTVNGASEAGAAYLFIKANSGWPNTADKVLADPLAVALYVFGSSVALSGDGTTAVIGAPQTTISGNPEAGAAYIYDASVDLSLVLASSPANVDVNGSVTYMLTVINKDTQVAATGLTLTDTLPAGMTYVSSSAGNGTCAYSSGTVTCTLASLAPQATWQPSITVTATTAGSLSDKASVSGSQFDPNRGNNTVTVTTTVTSGGGSSGGGGAFGWLSLLLLAPFARIKQRHVSDAASQ